MRNYPNIAHRVFNRPHLVEPHYGRVFVSALADRLDIRSITLPDGSQLSPRQMRKAARNYGGHEQKVFDETDGIAVIPAEGTLVHRLGYLNPFSGMTGYDGVQMKLEAALEDSSIRGILLDIDSPGGEVSGCFDLADFIYDARATKPIWALADELCCSAAFCLASACNRIIAPRTAQIGSVGVFTAHVDQSQMLKGAGIDVTLIFAGDHKVDGNPFEPLPADVRAEIQAEIDRLYQLFTVTVARNRGIGEQAVRDTQARIYSTREAIGVNFADEIMPARDVLAAFDEHLRGPRGSVSMQLPEVSRMAIFGMGRKAKTDRRNRAEQRAELEAQLAQLEMEPPEEGNEPSANEPEENVTNEDQGDIATNEGGASNKDNEAEEPASGEDDEPEPADRAAASLNELVELCAEAQCERLTKPFHEQGITLAEARARVEDVQGIRDAFAAAFPHDKQGASAMAEKFIDAAHTGRFAVAARHLLAEVTASASSEEIDHRPPTGGASKASFNAVQYYRNRARSAVSLKLIEGKNQ